MRPGGRGGTDSGAPASSASGTRYAAVLSLLLVCLFFLTAASLEKASGAFQSDYISYPDEPAHYVTGLMVRDYIAGMFPTSPMRFAESYYLHYPQVAFGHWPPGFYAVESLWMLCFGVSRASLMFLMAALAAITAFLIYKSARLEFGEAYAIAAGFAFVVLPSAQGSTSNVMGEMLAVALGLIAVLRFVRFLDRNRWQDACWFGIWAACAILTKQSGWSLAFVPPVAVLLTGQIRRFATLRFWLPVATVILLCGAYYAGTWHMLNQGLTGPVANLGATVASLPRLSQLLIQMTGWPLFLLFLCGLASKVVWPLRTATVTNYWASMAALFLGTCVFHALVLHGLTEQRHLLIGLPAMILFVMAGIQWVLSQRVLSGVSPALRGTLAAVCLVTAFAVTTFYVPKRDSRGFGYVAGRLLSRSDLRDAAILVSSNHEGAFVAAVAERDRRPGHYVLRATKMLARTSWNATDYKALYSSPAEVEQVLDDIPVTVLVLDTIRSGPLVPHHNLLLRMVDEHPQDWEQIDRYSWPVAPGATPQEIRVYRSRKVRGPGHPNFEVDLTDKIGKILRF